MPSEPLSLEKSIKARFAPVLRSDGYLGSGRVFRRLVGGMICIVQFQGSLDGGKFAVNLGIHPVVIDVLGFMPDPKKLNEAGCEFRRRLTATGPDQWWLYWDQSSLDLAVDDALHVYETVGRGVFVTQTGPDAPLDVITPEGFADGRLDLSGFRTTDVRTAWAIAIMRLAAGRKDDAKAFAQLALARLGGASGLRRELEEIAEGRFNA